MIDLKDNLQSQGYNNRICSFCNEKYPWWEIASLDRRTSRGSWPTQHYEALLLVLVQVEPSSLCYLSSHTCPTRSDTCQRRSLSKSPACCSPILPLLLFLSGLDNSLFLVYCWVPEAVVFIVGLDWIGVTYFHCWGRDSWLASQYWWEGRERNCLRQEE